MRKLQPRRSPTEDPTRQVEPAGKRTGITTPRLGLVGVDAPPRRGDTDGDPPATYALVRDGMLASDAATQYLLHVDLWQADYTDALRNRASDRATAIWFEQVAAYLAQPIGTVVIPGSNDPMLALSERVAKIQTSAANLEHVRDNIDAELGKVMRLDRQRQVFALIRARCRAFLDEVVAQDEVCPGGRIAGLLVANREGRPYDRSVFPKELLGLELSGAPEGRAFPWGDAATYAVEDVVTGLVAGVELAFADYVRFNMQSRMDHAEGEYRFEQVATQVLIGRALAEGMGTGAALAFAAFQWCFTNDLFFYLIGETMKNSVPQAWDHGGIPEDNITWSRWSALGVLKDEGNTEHPMSGRDAKLQGWALAPALAYVLAFLVEKLGGQALFGKLLSVSIDNLPDDDPDGAKVAALVAKLGLGDDAALVAAVAPLISDGRWEGRKFSCMLNVGTEQAGMFFGGDVSTRQVTRESDGATGHLTVSFLDAGLHCAFGEDSFQVAFGTRVHLPVMSTVVDDQKQPLDPGTFAIDPSMAGYWELRAHLLAGGFDGELSLRGSPDGKAFELGAGISYRAGKLTIGAEIYKVKGAAFDDAGIRLHFSLTR